MGPARMREKRRKEKVGEGKKAGLEAEKRGTAAEEVGHGKDLREGLVDGLVEVESCDRGVDEKCVTGWFLSCECRNCPVLRHCE